MSFIDKYILIEVWVTPGSKNKPETRRSRHTHFQDRDEAFLALSKAEGDFKRLLENVDDHKQIWHQ